MRPSAQTSRRGSLGRLVRVAVTACSRVDGVQCRAPSDPGSARRGGRHRREIRRDNGIAGETPRRACRPGVVERRRRRDLPVRVAPSRVEGALADGTDLLSALQRLVCSRAAPDPRGGARLAP